MDLIFVFYLYHIINNSVKCFLINSNIVFRYLFTWAEAYTIKNWPVTLSGNQYLSYLKTKTSNGYHWYSYYMWVRCFPQRKHISTWLQARFMSSQIITKNIWDFCWILYTILFLSSPIFPNYCFKNLALWINFHHCISSIAVVLNLGDNDQTSLV